MSSSLVNHYVSEERIFYAQNVLVHIFIALCLFSSIMLGDVSEQYYLLMIPALIAPHLFQLSRHLIDGKYYINLHVIFNSFMLVALVVVLGFNPIVLSLAIVVFSHSLLVTGGFGMWFAHFPLMLLSVGIMASLAGWQLNPPSSKLIVFMHIVSACSYMLVVSQQHFASQKKALVAKERIGALHKKQALILKNISRYISPSVVEGLVNDDQQINRHSRKMVTTFFSDLCGFTELSDTMSPEDLSLVLNQYLNKMTGIVHKHGGTLDKFIGDAVMVFFGAPSTYGEAEDAKRCLAMASEMQLVMHDLNREWRRIGLKRDLSVRMGVSSGWATVGNFGAQNQVNYTIIGRSVNLAARLESACKPNSILVSERVKELAGEEFQFDEGDLYNLKGLESPELAYELKGRSLEVDGDVEVTLKVNKTKLQELSWLLNKNGFKQK